METDFYNVNFLTNNNDSDSNPQISGKNVVWSGYKDGGNNEIYLYDHENASIARLTDNDAYGGTLSIDGNNVAWSSYEDGDNEIYFYNGSSTIQLTDNDVNDGAVRVSGNNVAWLSYEGTPNYRYPSNSEIYFYNGSSTIQLTDNDTYKNGFSLDGDKLAWSSSDGKDSEIFFFDGSEVIQLTTNATSDDNPQISGNNIVWTGYDGNDTELYLYNGIDITQITDNDTYESSPQISGNNVVWSAYDGNDNELYLYDGSSTIQLTDNDTYDNSPQISGNNVVWSAYDGNDDEIFLDDGSSTIQLTDNDTSDYAPRISGNNVVWSAYDGNDTEIAVNYAINLVPGAINGYKWHDLNQDGVFDADESGIEDWTIYLDSNQNGRLDNGETSTLTDADGFYSFTNLGFGTYTVAEQVEPRWNQTFSAAIEYAWQDSLQPDGVTYDWVDISGVGTELELGDDNSKSVALPFTFDFYGKANNSVNISADGYLTFADDATDYSYQNNPITNSYNLSDFIAPFWDDLNPGYSGKIYHHYDAEQNRFIVQYQDVARYEVEGGLTFQTILNADGSIVFQYNSLDAAVDSATVGLENPEGDAGLQIVHNNQNYVNPYLKNGLAIAFTPTNTADAANNREVFVGTGETIADLNFGNSLEAIRIEAEDYQDYSDSTPGNEGGEYRDDDVDLGVSGDVGGGYTVGWTDSSEWLTYSVDIPEAGTYRAVARVASDSDTDSSLDLAIDGQSTTVEFGSTGGWQAWDDVVSDELELTAGTHELRLDLGSGFNLNYIDLITPEDIRVEAEDYLDDRYTADQTFYDNDYENQGGGYRDRPVDIEPTSDISGGFNVGWIEAGEWLTYNVDIPYDGNYQVTARVASDLDTDHSLDISINGQNTNLGFGDTGGWQSWTDVVGEDLYFTAGTHEMRVDMNTSGFNLNHIDFDFI